MANFIIEDVKNIFKGKDTILSQIIVLNVAVFIVFNIIENFYPIKFWFMLPGNLLGLITKPHTIVTYMFLHASFFHILFNMLWLYYMGQILIEYLGTKKFSAAYFLGGIAGGLAFVLFSNIVSGINGLGSLGLVGASGAVMAVVFAVATLLPEFTFRLFLIGNVKMKYVAAGALILTSVLDFSVNTGGKIAHFGGALFGFVYIKYLQKGNDLGEPFYKVVNFFKYLFSSKPKKMKVTHRNSNPKHSAAAPKAKQEVIDRILDKISKSGYDSLTKEEKEILFKMSKEN
jgi:membrane associated rhomboid family serine protease